MELYLIELNKNKLAYNDLSEMYVDNTLTIYPTSFKTLMNTFYPKIKNPIDFDNYYKAWSSKYVVGNYLSVLFHIIYCFFLSYRIRTYKAVLPYLYFDRNLYKERYYSGVIFKTLQEEADLSGEK
jgi:hypothetical protein